MTRKKLLAANWKMYKTPAQATDFARAFVPLVQHLNRDEIALCAPAVCIAAVVNEVRDSGIGVGAQNMHWEKEGAYTGELSALQLVAAGCTHVIIGHSERRQ